jgi:hypothetical protein
MKPSTLILNHLLPRDSVELGRLVTNINDPLQDYCQLDPLSLSDDSISTQCLENFNAILHVSKGSGLSAFLTQMLSGSWSVSRRATTDIAATAYETIQLGNCEEVLRSACKSDPVRNWFERAARRRRNVYIVSGLKILVNARVRQTRVKTVDKGVSVQAPGLLITAATGVPIPLDNTLDVGVKRTFNNNSAEQGGYMASGEHIFAIQYRKVRMKEFSTKAFDPAYLLEGARWKIYLSTRGRGDIGVDENDDGMEVEAGEPIRGQDIKRPCEHFEDEDEEILFCPRYQTMQE